MIYHLVHDPTQGVDVMDHQVMPVGLQQADFFQVAQFTGHAFAGGVGSAGEVGMGRRW